MTKTIEIPEVLKPFIHSFELVEEKFVKVQETDELSKACFQAYLTELESEKYINYKGEDLGENWYSSQYFNDRYSDQDYNEMIDRTLLMVLQILWKQNLMPTSDDEFFELATWKDLEMTAHFFKIC